MVVNVVILLVLVALIVLFAWLAKRAWGSHHKILKWPLLVLSGLVTLLFLLITVVGAKGTYQIYAPYAVAPVSIDVKSTPDQLARGEHLATVLCAGCHTTNGQLPLSGGNNMSADAGLPLGDIYPSNITPGGNIKNLSDADILRIMRTGVEPGGRLTFMNFVNARHISDEDSQAIIAYLRTQPAVQEQTPPVNFSFLTALLAGAGLISPDVPTTVGTVTAPPKAETAAYGEYVVNYMDCRSCHGATLTGDAKPPLPAGPNLTLIVPQWSRDDFFKAIRTGVDKTGHQIQPPMPWKTIGQLDDTELGAVYQYLHGLAPVATKK